MTRVALTIAGSDPSGGAGLQADLKTFHQFGAYGMAVVSVLTVQSTQGVTRVECVSPELLDQQLAHLLADITPHAAKTGALGRAALVEVVAARAQHFTFPLVVDPVMISKHGHPLIDADARETLVKKLLPHTTLLTPNTHEAGVLTGREVKTLAEARDAARALCDLGPRAVLVKGGHLDGAPVDVLCERDVITEFHAARVDTKHTHGTGCTYSAAITALLANGVELAPAIERAKRWFDRGAPDLARSGARHWACEPLRARAVEVMATKPP